VEGGRRALHSPARLTGAASTHSPRWPSQASPADTHPACRARGWQGAACVPDPCSGGGACHSSAPTPVGSPGQHGHQCEASASLDTMTPTSSWSCTSLYTAAAGESMMMPATQQARPQAAVSHAPATAQPRHAPRAACRQAQPPGACCQARPRAGPPENRKGVRRLGKRTAPAMTSSLNSSHSGSSLAFTAPGGVRRQQQSAAPACPACWRPRETACTAACPAAPCFAVQALDAQRSAAQRSAAQRSAAQRSAAQRSLPAPLSNRSTSSLGTMLVSPARPRAAQGKAAARPQLWRLVNQAYPGKAAGAHLAAQDVVGCTRQPARTWPRRMVLVARGSRRAPDCVGCTPTNVYWNTSASRPKLQLFAGSSASPSSCLPCRQRSTGGRVVSSCLLPARDCLPGRSDRLLAAIVAPAVPAHGKAGVPRAGWRTWNSWVHSLGGTTSGVACCSTSAACSRRSDGIRHASLGRSGGGAPSPRQHCTAAPTFMPDTTSHRLLGSMNSTAWGGGGAHGDGGAPAGLAHRLHGHASMRSDHSGAPSAGAHLPSALWVLEVVTMHPRSTAIACRRPGVAERAHGVPGALAAS